MITPFRNQILIRPIENEGALGDKSLCKYGEVIAVGKQVEEIQVGQTIGFIEWGMNSLKINDETHYFITEDSRFILGTISLPEQLPS